MGFNRLYGYSILPIIVNLQIVEKKFKRGGVGGGEFKKLNIFLFRIFAGRFKCIHNWF